MSQSELIEVIRDAFIEELYPGDSNLVCDNSGNHYECDEVKKAFTGKKWQELTKQFLINHRRDYSFFSREGFKYYLPAFMIFTATEFDDSDDLPFNLVNALTLPTELDTVIMANNIKKYLIDKQMPDIDFDFVLRNQLHYTNQDVHNFIARFSWFTLKQGNAVYQFLHFLKQEHGEEFFNREIDISLDRYWFQFE